MKKIISRIFRFLLWVCFVEALSFLALAALKKDFSALSISRQQQTAAAKTLHDRVRPIFPGVEGEALNPYVGYTLQSTPEDIYGFGNRVSPVQKRGPDHFIVGITGGSVAYQLWKQHSGFLTKELRKIPELADKKIILIEFALGGYKQPQQLMALNYLLSLGGEFDLVINVDGFNETGLSQANAPALFPLYPRAWFARVALGAIPKIAVTAQLAKNCAEWRARLAKFVSSVPVLKNSPTVHLLWQFCDMLLEKIKTGANRYIGNYPFQEKNFNLEGPPISFPDPKAFHTYIADAWVRSSLLMAKICGAENTRYFHFLQPNQYDEGSKLLSSEEREKYYNENHPYRKGVVEGYSILREKAREGLKGINFYDLSRVFIHHPETLYSDDCCHVNRLGGEILAAEIVRVIRQNH